MDRNSEQGVEHGLSELPKNLIKLAFNAKADFIVSTE